MDVIFLIQYNPTNQAVDIKVYTHNARATVYLPRNFRGPITAGTVHGGITFSSEIQKNLTVFSEVDGTRKAFLGEHAETRYGVDGLDWDGDQLEIGSKNAGVKVYYVDDLDCASSSAQRWWSKLWS